MGQLMNRRKALNSTLWNSVSLPSAYMRLPYVLGNNTASHFDTGISGTNENLRIQLCMEMNFTTNYFYLFGNYIDETTNCWRLITTNTGDSFYFTPGTRANASGIVNLGSSYVDRKIYFDLQRSLAFGVAENVRYKTGTSYKSGTANSGNIILGYSHAGNGSSSSSKRVKWYYCTIWDNGVLIRNYIPCKRVSDDKPGFYDTINDAFKISEGSQDFLLP